MAILENPFVRFSATAMLGTVLVASLLAVGYGHLTRTNLTELGTEQNGIILRFLANSSEKTVQSLLDATREQDRVEQESARDRLSRLLSRETPGLPVHRVNVFAQDGMTVYSTDAKRIGLDASGNPGVAAALSGATVSDIIHGHWNALDDQREVTDLIQTYAPIRDVGGVISGVLEVYSDVTPLSARITRTQQLIGFGSAGMVGGFCLLLGWMYRRTHLALQSEEARARSYLEQIENDKRTLERRVQDRTEELVRARTFLQTAIDGVPDPAIVVDRDHRITAFNLAARRQRMHLVDDGSARCYRALHGYSEPCDRLGKTCTLHNGEPCTRIEPRPQPDGSVHHIQIRTTPLRAPGGEITGAIEVVHDLNRSEELTLALQQEKKQAETASRIKSAFVATMSHEIRTPLNAMLGMTDLLRLTNLSRKQLGYIDIIQSSGNMLASLMDNILEFTRLSTDGPQVSTEDFNLIELLERVLQIAGYHAYSKGLELLLDVRVPLDLRIHADRNRIRQILINLVNNAIKFSATGSVTIRVESAATSGETQALRFTVADEGIGMTDAVKAKLFQPFALVDEQSAVLQQGTGLGLAICKEFVTRMKGDIVLDSQPGKGTRVTVTLPVETRETRPLDLSQPVAALAGRRVLVACRQQAVADLLSGLLGIWQLRCDVAPDQATALARLTREVQSADPYALAILDQEGMTDRGLELARRIREDQRLSRLPLLLLTPIARPLEPGAITRIGTIFCVNKPILPRELHLTLFELMDSLRISEARRGQPANHGGATSDVRILVADDNPVNSQVLLGMLGALGHQADSVADGPAVLAALQQRSYELVLMDCQMPGMDGEQVTREIRSRTDDFPHQPLIVAITADTSIERRRVCLDAGMDDFIAKPLRLAGLTTALDRWLSSIHRPPEAETTEPAADDDVPTATITDDQHTRRVLQERTAGQDSFLNAYIDLFLDDASRRLDRLQRALDDGDFSALARQSHAMKGASLELGVVRMSNLCDELRASAEERKLNRAQTLIDHLTRELERIRPVLEAEKKCQFNAP